MTSSVVFYYANAVAIGGRKKFPKGPPFAYVFLKNFKIEIIKGGGGSVGFSPPPLSICRGRGIAPWPPR